MQMENFFCAPVVREKCSCRNTSVICNLKALRAGTLAFAACLLVSCHFESQLTPRTLEMFLQEHFCKIQFS